MDRKDRIEKIESKKKEVDEKVKRSVGWSVSAFRIIMENKLVIASCLLIQGLFYVFCRTLPWNGR